ncbi:MAG TPA: twin-arginine translocase subunit TatC [Bacteroidota bacterium]|nr:twin-arginine translocase subunit TatC [Bacteroidota bacterium]
MTASSPDTPDGTEEFSSDEKEMSFLDHLEELRWHLIKSAAGVLAAVALCGYFADWIINEVILRPGTLTDPPLELINTIPYGQITFYMMVVIVSGLVLSVPWILYQIWKFIQPGLLPKERKYISKIVTFSSLCFFAGVAFSYFVMLPYMLQFFTEFGTKDIKNMIAVSEYMSFVIQLVLISGLIFELPMVSYFLARFGILTPAFMRHYRRHSYVVILIVAALVTPTTDPVTMSVFSVPIALLYELSIGIAGMAKRKRDAASPSIMDMT